MHYRAPDGTLRRRAADVSQPAARLVGSDDSFTVFDVERFDVIVLGLGGMGSAALYQLACRGLRVCGIEQFGLAHAKGSSNGQSRLIRRAYFEHPGYVPLVDEAWGLWRQLEEECSTKLLLRTGLLLSGPPDGAVVRGTRAAAAEHRLEISAIAPDAVRRQWPMFAFAEGADVLFEPDAGCLLVEECVKKHVVTAQRRGAQAHFEQAVTGWRADQSGVVVETAGGRFAGERLIICGGAWSGRLLAGLRLPLRVLRKNVCWFPESDPAMRVEAGCPAFGFDTPNGFCYGFPSLGERGAKLANHTGGEEVSDPSTLNREVSAEETRAIERFRDEHVPGAAGPVGRSCVCMYTMTPDEHFMVGPHPQHPNVFVACGFSGHGFKFAPVIGRVLADLACGRSEVPGPLRPLA